MEKKKKPTNSQSSHLEKWDGKEYVKVKLSVCILKITENEINWKEEILKDNDWEEDEKSEGGFNK